MANDSITWGKRSAMTQWLAGWNESIIGEAMWQLAGGERTAATYLSWGKKWWKGKSFCWPAVFIARGERGLGGGPLESASDADVELGQRAISVRQFSLFPGHRWVGLGQCLKGGMSLNRHLGCTVHSPTHKTWFIIFSNWTKIVNYENYHSVVPKFTKLCNLIEWNISNNFPFGSKLDFRTKF
jgi:hypothetical protein